MSEFTDEQLVDFVLGLGTGGGLEDAIRTQPELRRRCGAVKTDLCRLEEELEELVASGPCDVLTKASWRILLAVDGSAGARRATLAALALASRSDGVVEVLHVCRSEPRGLGRRRRRREADRGGRPDRPGPRRGAQPAGS